MSGLAADLVLAERFRLRRMLGRGGSAEVWLASDTALAVDVALKTITVADPAAASRLADTLCGELEPLQRLVHPGIVRIHGVHADGARCCISMEAVIGAESAALRGAAWQRIVAALIEVVEALQYAHAQGVVHDAKGVPFADSEFKDINALNNIIRKEDLIAALKKVLQEQERKEKELGYEAIWSLH